MVKSRYIGDGHPTFNRNPYNGYINPYYWVDELIPYYMEIWEFRPWHIYRYIVCVPNSPTLLTLILKVSNESVDLS